MIDKLSDAIAALLPPELREELRGNIDALLRGAFDKMNLTTRERFEIQEKVLQRTRARVRELEEQMSELEKRLDAALSETQKRASAGQGGGEKNEDSAAD